MLKVVWTVEDATSIALRGTGSKSSILRKTTSVPLNALAGDGSFGLGNYPTLEERRGGELRLALAALRLPGPVGDDPPPGERATLQLDDWMSLTGYREPGRTSGPRCIRGTPGGHQRQREIGHPYSPRPRRSPAKPDDGLRGYGHAATARPAARFRPSNRLGSPP